MMQKLLPPILFLLLALAIALYSYWLNPKTYLAFPVTLLGGVLICAGLFLAIIAKRQFKRKKTNVLTFGRPDVLVTDGVFKFTRNPMYLGLAIALLGVCVIHGLAIEYLVLEIIFILIVRKWYIDFEEKMMKESFASAYVKYCENTRRWF